jgi:molybdopterin-guanine dinucleotide biosynthesis protein A
VIQYDAIVPAGGDSLRFGSDKLAYPIAGRPLLDHALDAVATAHQVVVVGAPRPTQRLVTWTLEEPPGGGPLAGVAAAIRFTCCPLVVLLAGDMPRASSAVAALLQAASGATSPEVCVTVDDDERLQPLTAVWPRQRLVERLAELGDVNGLAMMRLYDGVKLTTVDVGTDALVDIDTLDDVRSSSAPVVPTTGPGAPHAP